MGRVNPYEINKWDLRFLDLAKEIATWSKDPSSQIGAIAVGKNRRILSTGYNGFPRGVEDSPSRYKNKETKYKFVVHAELNCVCNAGLNGVSLDGATLYVHGIPVCHECAKAVIQSGITNVIMRHKPLDQKWIDSFGITKVLFNESYVEWFAYEDPSISCRNEPSGQTDVGEETKHKSSKTGRVEPKIMPWPVLFYERNP